MPPVLGTAGANATGSYANNVLTEATKPLSQLLGTRLYYMVTLKTQVKKVRDAVKKVMVRKEDIENHVRTSKFARKEESKAAGLWISKAKKLAEDFENMIAAYKGKGDVQGSTEGLQNSDASEDNVQHLNTEEKLKLNWWKFAQRWKMGAEAERISTEAENLLKELSDLEKLVPSDAAAYSFLHVTGFQDFSSTREACEKVINALSDNYIVGIYGTGGIGKTCILDKVGLTMVNEGVVDKIVKVTLSRDQDPNPREVQDCIAQQLPNFSFRSQSTEQRSAELKFSLKTVPKLLIMLDNVWTHLRLEEAGIPSQEEHGGCKVLMATQSVDVCNSMVVHAQIPVSFLSLNDSWRLFETNAGEVKTEMQSVAQEVIEECCGLPLALVVVGRALHGQKRTSDWEDALVKLKQADPRNLNGVVENLFKNLESSYTNLQGEDVRLLFLLCSLFPSGDEISEEELTRYWNGENTNPRLTSVDALRREVRMLISKLKSSCLLLSADKEGTIKMHPMIRNVAVWIASREENGFFVDCGASTDTLLSEEIVQSCTRMSLIKSQINELQSPRCSKIKLLLLRDNEFLQEIPDNFFESMHDLIVLDMSESRISILPSSVKSLKSLRTCCLNGCNSLFYEVSMIGMLGNLRVLSLKGCCFGSLPIQLKELENLKVLDVSSSTGIDVPSFTVPAELVSSLRVLEELYLDSKSLDETVLVEIASLKHLKLLQFYVWDSTLLSRDIVPDASFGNLTSYAFYTDLCLIVQSKSNKLCMEGVELIAGWVKPLLAKAEELKFKNCFQNRTDIVQFAALDSRGSFHSLKILHLTRCGIKYLAGGERYTTEFPFGKLEDLHLIDCSEVVTVFNLEHASITEKSFAGLKTIKLETLPKLASIWTWGESIPAALCSNLTEICITDCKEVKFLFSDYFASRLNRLESLIVEGNSKVEMIVSNEERTEENAEANLHEQAFPNLKYLSLKNLPKLKHFYRVGAEVRIFRMESLRSLVLESCPVLKVLPLGSGSAPNLETIKLTTEADVTWFNGLRWNDEQAGKHFKNLVLVE